MTRKLSTVAVYRHADGNYKLPFQIVDHVYNAIFADEDDEDVRSAFIDRVWSTTNENFKFPLSRLPVVSQVNGWTRPLVDIVLDLVDRLRRAPAADAMKMAAVFIGHREDDDEPPFMWPHDLLRRACDADFIIQHEIEPPAKGALPVDMPAISSEGSISDIRAKRDRVRLGLEEPLPWENADLTLPTDLGRFMGQKGVKMDVRLQDVPDPAMRILTMDVYSVDGACRRISLSGQDLKSFLRNMARLQATPFSIKSYPEVVL